ncbi:hypothetical protein CLCR_06451 [Cladophialophora carrionii]|uniref:Uncharacterized protein n=1 Tax=Cladophialophora carrionii TaxID=86049 RepID=A0A1C1C937_9EURO|nr:hypothetical protein CLCR_06451 [Cladophialophora carrionii]
MPHEAHTPIRHHGPIDSDDNGAHADTAQNQFDQLLIRSQARSRHCLGHGWKLFNGFLDLAGHEATRDPDLEHEHEHQR